MKATIEFNLPEEQGEYRMHTQASAMSSAIYDFTNVIREKVKYAEVKSANWSEIHDLWWDILRDYELDPYA